MRKEDIESYLNRPWEELAALKRRYWVERKRALGPAEGIRVADELRRLGLLLRPGWPGEADRAADIENHARVSELLRRADVAACR